MRFFVSLKKLLGIACVLLLVASTAAARTGKKTTHGSTSTTAKSHVTAPAKASKHTSKSSRSKSRKSKKARGPRGQRSIDGERAREIQQALIREKYLDGEATGMWDQRTREALIRYQGDNGWQNKVVPDSRALIKLGLGPNHANLINPDSAALPDSARDLRPGGGPPQQ